MKTLCRLLLACVFAASVCHSQSLPVVQLSEARTVFIESEANNMPLDAVHLALSSSRLRWVEDRQTADLILKFNREVAKTDRSVQGNQISFGVHWNYTLVVSLPNGTILYRDQAPEHFVPGTDSSEEGWIKYLRTTPKYGLTKKLASQFPRK
jgi:hypothetical protein